MKFDVRRGFQRDPQPYRPGSPEQFLHESGIQRQRLLTIFLADEDVYEVFVGGNRHEDLASYPK